MKISKLFHWLYAILMLLPFVFFVPSVLYYAFNDNALMQSVEVPKIETFPIDFNQLQIEDVSSGTEYDVSYEINDYYLSIVGTSSNENSSFNLRSLHTAIKGHVYLYRGGYYNADLNVANNYAINKTYLNNDVLFSVSETYTSYWLITQNLYNVPINYETYFNIFDLTQMFGSGNEPTIAEFNLMFPNDYYGYVESQPMQVTYDTGETEQLISNTDIINYAWESIWDLPLFNWCKVSFVSVPFTYITGLFGLAASNSFNYVFTYFASMSIIWLVFDVIMYVPLLVHRWLDKGIVE